VLIVSDANIFIDMDCAGLTARMFRLPEEFAVPDVQKTVGRLKAS